MLREELAASTSRNRALERRLQVVEEQQSFWSINGAESLLGGYGFAVFGAGAMRLSQYGVQMLASSGTPGVFWVSEYAHEPRAGEDPSGALAKPYAYIIDSSSPSTGVSQLSLASAGAEVGNRAVLALYGGDGSSNIGTQSGGTSKGPFISTEAPLELNARSSDPAADELADAFVWFRTDTAKARLRANGATDNFAMEGWVTSALTAPWVVASESSGPYSAGVGEFVLADGTFTVNLPENAASGSVIVVKNVGSGTITVSRSGADTIDGATSMTLTTQYEAYNYVSDGANWWVY